MALHLSPAVMALHLSPTVMALHLNPAVMALHLTPAVMALQASIVVMSSLKMTAFILLITSGNKVVSSSLEVTHGLVN